MISRPSGPPRWTNCPPFGEEPAKCRWIVHHEKKVAIEKNFIFIFRYSMCFIKKIRRTQGEREKMWFLSRNFFRSKFFRTAFPPTWRAWGPFRIRVLSGHFGSFQTGRRVFPNLDPAGPFRIRQVLSKHLGAFQTAEGPLKHGSVRSFQTPGAFQTGPGVDPLGPFKLQGRSKWIR